MLCELSGPTCYSSTGQCFATVSSTRSKFVEIASGCQQYFTYLLVMVPSHGVRGAHVLLADSTEYQMSFFPIGTTSAFFNENIIALLSSKSVTISIKIWWQQNVGRIETDRGNLFLVICVELPCFSN